jgi:hypothetical protein
MANWEEILKKPLVSIPKQRIRIKKPKKIEQEDDCKSKLLEIAKRMTNVPLFDLELSFEDVKWTPQELSRVTDGSHGGQMKVATWIPEDLSNSRNKTHGAIGYLRGGDGRADIDVLPEKVCCEALKHLKAASTGNVLSEQLLLGWKIGSQVKLETYGGNPTTHLWNREVYVNNAQGPSPKLTIGMSLKLYLPTPFGGQKGDVETENLIKVTRAFKECNRMFKEAVG